MQTLQWDEALCLDFAVMDQTHQEFVQLLADVARSLDDELIDRWQRLIEHTDAHFAQEDRWMQDTGFGAGNCHSTQHKVVLQVLREGFAAGQAGQLHVIRQMAHELATWFPHHAQSMDAGLALHMRQLGYDPQSGEIMHPELLPQQVMTGCGSSRCQPAPESTATPATTVPA